MFKVTFLLPFEGLAVSFVVPRKPTCYIRPRYVSRIVTLTATDIAAPGLETSATTAYN